MKSLIRLFKKKRRSVVFYRHSYYHFYYLAQALRKRGWDAIVVNLEPTTGINANYYHGEDLNLYDENPQIFQKNIKRFFKVAKSRFKLMHFAGDDLLSFYPENINYEDPPDIIMWKQQNNKIAYTISGCNSGTSQTMVGQWSIADNALNVCDRCVWQDNNEVCNDQKNLNWGGKIHKYCDLIFSETLPALDHMKSNEKIIREPITMCLDPKFWALDLEIPPEHVIPKQKEEILIYHAVGNYNIRNTETRNIKGTPFVVGAVERLQEEGYKVKLIFITDKPNKVVRFYQAQADIIVDQLNYGRYGANAREGMMLGKPVICYINKFEFDEKDKLECLNECPLISATELTVYDNLKKLILDADLRKSIGEQSRKYAVKWHSADACAERYEKIYDTLFS
ncbi:glycosyltransferase [Legionella yabuuchiae]|uniref:glycosyltransferase n=1 Tax=Legionella yabuuchiae TaxID=376727 RepID=UPI0010555544|nr:glycosyltransferase [Legionella yabuuchiae]